MKSLSLCPAALTNRSLLYTRLISGRCAGGLFGGRHCSWQCMLLMVFWVCRQVKLLKCLVDNIVVDISYDTIGGLCTVAFLESIDRHIGEKHLFKRSVILVGCNPSAHGFWAPQLRRP